MMGLLISCLFEMRLDDGIGLIEEIGNEKGMVI